MIDDLPFELQITSLIIVSSFDCVFEWGTVGEYEDKLNYDDRFMVQQSDLPTGYFGLDCHGDEPTLGCVDPLFSSLSP